MRIGRIDIHITPKKAKTAEQLTDQQILLRELLESHIRWAKVNKEYSDGFLLLLHNFSPPKDEVEEAEVIK